MINKFLEKKQLSYKIALFVSGNGSNAEKILEYHKEHNCRNWDPVVIVTDNPQKSRAGEIALKYGIECIKHDIRKFYRERGENRVTLFTEAGRRIREEWTQKLRKYLQPYSIDFGILAGFVPLTNITGDFPCLNVHPGDLTVTENGKRILVGLHTVPIEAALLRGFQSLRSSVIIAQPYSGEGGEMDSGPILGISAPVEVDLHGKTLMELKSIAANRPERRPVGGFKDELEEIAALNQEQLKIYGDWIVFPPVIDDFASGKFALNENGGLLYLESSAAQEIKTVEYSESKKLIIKKR
jgi:folate-dependent phosphoribosylglycinamide formyltransferase PurN